MPDVAGDLYHAPDQLSTLRVHALHQAVQIDYVGGTNPIYVGSAIPGTPTATAGWRIAKLTWDANNNPLTVQWAGGSNQYVNVWDNRAALSYS